MLPVIVLVGATATGKSGLAVDIAVALAARGTPAEVVNADSMLVYRGMDIGTAKPSLAERRGVPHHLIDIRPVTARASVADFQALARSTIAEVRERGGVPIVVGGSALYTRAITDRFDFPGSDADIRARLEADLERDGPEALHARLLAVAPASAAQISPGNGRRIVRALEVAELTGGHAPVLPAWTYELDGVVQFGLELERAQLDARIDERVDAMFDAGLVDEVRRLLGQGLADGETARVAIGYRQVIDLLSGRGTEPEARDAVKRATRRFFRRQLSWYRRDPRITWLPADSPDNVAAVLASIDLVPAGEGSR